MPVGLISIDTEHLIVTANGTALEIYARSEADMRGKTLQQLMGAEKCSLAPLLRAGNEFIDQPIDCLRQDGETVPLKVSASHLRDRERDLRGMVLNLRDQREIKVMEDALAVMQRSAPYGASLSIFVATPSRMLRQRNRVSKLCKCVVVKRDLSPRFYLESRV